MFARPGSAAQGSARSSTPASPGRGPRPQCGLVRAKGLLPWPRTLIRLSGYFRCNRFGSVRPTAAMFDHSPVTWARECVNSPRWQRVLATAPKQLRQL
jgi:hypothetical protein